MRLTIKKQLKKGIAVVASAAMLFTGLGMTSYAKEVVVNLPVSENQSNDADTEETHSKTDAEQLETMNEIALFSNDAAAYAANVKNVESDYMQYIYKSDKIFDIQGKYNGGWIYTTYQWNQKWYTIVTDSLQNGRVSAIPTLSYGGRFITVTYKVTAVGGDIVDGKFGVHADVQIGDNDNATVTLIKEGNKNVGFQMIDDKTSSESYNACFQLYFAGSTLGGSEASTYWMGHFGFREENLYSQTSATSVSGIDSGIALSWQNINLKQGESKEYKMMLGIGTEKDLQEAIGSGTDYNQECIKDLEPGNYAITITDESGKTYYFNGVTDAGIPFKGTDSNGEAYDFTGKKLSIVKKNSDGSSSSPSEIEVAARPAAPAAVDMSDVMPSTDEKQVILNQAGADQEYILVPEGTTVTEAMWENAQKAIGSSVTLTTDASNGQAIDVTMKYVIYTRKYATSSAPKSDVTGPSNVIAFHNHNWAYKAQENKLSVTCATTDPNTCAYHTSGATLTLYAPTQTTYSGEEVEASYEYGEAEAWKYVTGTAAPTIQYEYKATADGTYASTTETKNAGYYRATATCGNQTASVEFEIKKKEITSNDVVLDKDSFTVATDGITAQAPNITVKSNNKNLVQGSDYTLSGDTSKVFAGNYTITVSGTGNYTGTVTKTWKIEKNPQTLANMNPTISDANILATQVIVDESVGGAGDVTYAISETNKAPADGWQSSNVFSGLKPETTYYVFVRCAGNEIYDPATSNGTVFTTKAIANVDVEGIAEAEGIANPGITYDGAPVTVADIITGTPSVTEKPFDVTYTYIDVDNNKELSSAPANAGTYKLIVTVKSANTTATKEIAFKIKDAEQSTIEAEKVAVEPTTIYGKGDGKITGLSPEYEYSTDGGNTYTTCEGSELSGVSGTVKIRRKAKTNYVASEPIDVVIPEGKKIKLQVPDIKNCTITASPSEVAYNESATITIKPDSGYKLTEPLTAVIGGVERTFVKDADGNYTCTISDIKKMDALKVTGTTGVVEKSYEDVTPATGSIKDITDTKDAAAETNAFASEIKNNSELEKLLDVTAQEKAQGVNIWLKVVDASSTAPKADKEVIENAKNDFNVGMILDVSLFKKIGDQEAQKITNTNGMTKISVLVPEELRKSGRMYEIIRVHNGVPTVILPAYDADAYTLTFETDQFSTYAITYKDADTSKVEEAPSTSETNKAPETQVTNKTTESQVTNNTQNAQVTNKSNAPATGDSFDPIMLFAIMGVSLLAILGIMNKKYKDGLKEEKHQK